MKSKLYYSYFRKAMLNDYSEKEIRQLFNSVRKMDAESRRWVAAWLNGEGYPKAEIEKFDIYYLIDKCNFRPINAMIILDWLKNEPEAAKFSLQHYLVNKESDVKIKEKDDDPCTDDFDEENEYIEY